MNLLLGVYSGTKADGHSGKSCSSATKGQEESVKNRLGRSFFIGEKRSFISSGADERTKTRIV